MINFQNLFDLNDFFLILFFSNFLFNSKNRQFKFDLNKKI